MKFIASSPALVLGALVIALSGCAQSHGSWLDQVGRLPNPRIQMSDEEAGRLTAEVAVLRAQAEALRIQLNAEPDRLQRMDRYAELRYVTDELVPIERRLIEAGRLPREKTPG